MPESVQLAEQILAWSKLSWIGVSRQTADLSETEFLSLDHIVESGTANVGQINKHVGVLPAQMSRILRRIEGAGFIHCGINPQDKRKVDVEITAAGRRAHAAYRHAKLAPIAVALERLTPAERTRFMQLVQKMVHG